MLTGPDGTLRINKDPNQRSDAHLMMVIEQTGGQASAGASTIQSPPGTAGAGTSTPGGVASPGNPVTPVPAGGMPTPAGFDLQAMMA